MRLSFQRMSARRIESKPFRAPSLRFHISWQLSVPVPSKSLCTIWRS
jgi:hypothetical protein